MKIETILNAMVMADRRRIAPSYLKHLIRNSQRQYNAFRDRILRMDAEKDARIAELEAAIDRYRSLPDRPFDDPAGRYELTNEEWSALSKEEQNDHQP